MLRHLLRRTHAAVRETFKGLTRSASWRKVRKDYLLKHPRCEACGSKTAMQVHHVEPFHLRPELELEPTNLIALCMSKSECHLNLGHGDDFATFNPMVRSHCERFRLSTAKERAAIVADAKAQRRRA
jgi:hypothetical protein